jgi:hypothetical protein
MLVHPIGDAQQAEEGLLDDIVRLGRVAQVAHAQCMKTTLVTAEEPLEGADVAETIGVKESDVVEQ